MRRGPFSDEHEMLRRTLRAFDKEVTPHVGAWEDAGQIPKGFAGAIE